MAFVSEIKHHGWGGTIPEKTNPVKCNKITKEEKRMHRGSS